MSRDVFRMFLEFTRKKTLDTLDAIAKRPDAKLDQAPEQVLQKLRDVREQVARELYL